MLLMAASSVGRTHAHRAKQRQDAYGFKLASDVLMCAIADGVSSGDMSGPAADVAVASALDAAVRSVPRDSSHDLAWLRQATDQASEAVYQLAIDLTPADETGPHHCASTLVLAAIRPGERHGEMRVSVVSIGDSSALELTTTDDITVIVGPLASRHSQELHNYLPLFGSQVVTSTYVISTGSTLLLVTDGLADDIRDSETVRVWLGKQLRTATSVVAVAHTLSYMRQRSGDDRTFIAVRPH